jgi:hypothetical protein
VNGGDASEEFFDLTGNPPLADSISKLVLGNDAQQDPGGRPRGGYAPGTVLTFVGLPGHCHAIAVGADARDFAYAMVSCLVVNDAVKVAMINGGSLESAYPQARMVEAWTFRSTLLSDGTRPMQPAPPKG